MLSFFNTEIGRIIVSIVWGIGLSTLFKRVCKNKKCIIIESPNPKDIEEKIFRYKGDSNCYRYNTYISKCSSNSKKLVNNTYTKNIVNKNEDKKGINMSSVVNLLKKYNINI